jgi:iron complex outermembrane receptor protein
MLFENQSRASPTPPYTAENGVYDAAAFNHNKLLVTAASYVRPIGRVQSTSTVTFSRHELDPQSGYWNVYSNMQRSYKFAYGSMAKVEEQLAWKPAPSIEVTAGGTFERFHAIPQTADVNAPIASHDQPGTLLGTTIPDELVRLRYFNAGAFGQAQYAITPAVGLTLGGRADYNTRYDATFNPRIGLVAQPGLATTLKVLYGSAYLAPSPYQAYGHFGSFTSTDGGQTYASSYWHVANTDLKPQHKKTLEINLLHALGNNVHLSVSGFNSWFTDTVKSADSDQAYAGLYLGWPVEYIDFPINEGHARIYGGNLALAFLHAPDAERRIEATAAVALVDGLVWERPHDLSLGALPIGAMAPVQLRFTADVDWHRWSVAPRLAVVGAQRVLATTEADPGKRRTLPGYAVVDVNVRRLNLFNNIDAFVMLENAFDHRYRTININAYTNSEELIGSPQNPRRITIGFDLRLK